MRPDCDTYYMDLAFRIARRSNCAKKAVGAIVQVNKRVAAIGFNGTPEDMTDCFHGGCRRCADLTKGSGEGYDHCICVHAEQSALLTAVRTGTSLIGATLYTTLEPCFTCLKECLQVGVKKIFYLEGNDIPHEQNYAYLEFREKANEKLELKRFYSSAVDHLPLWLKETHRSDVLEELLKEIFKSSRVTVALDTPDLANDQILTFEQRLEHYSDFYEQTRKQVVRTPDPRLKELFKGLHKKWMSNAMECVLVLEPSDYL